MAKKHVKRIQITIFCSVSTNFLEKLNFSYVFFLQKIIFQFNNYFFLQMLQDVRSFKFNNIKCLFLQWTFLTFFQWRGEGLGKVRGASAVRTKSGQRNRIVFAILAKKNGKKMAKNFGGHCNAQYQQISLALQGCTTSILIRFMFFRLRTQLRAARLLFLLTFFCLNHRQAKGKVVVVVCLFVFCFFRKSFLFCFKRSSCSKKSLVGFLFTQV